MDGQASDLGYAAFYHTCFRNALLVRGTLTMKPFTPALPFKCIHPIYLQTSELNMLALDHLDE